MLFGKDSTDRKDFQIKTLGKDNAVIPQIEHEVSAILIVDGEEISIRRILKENWVKKRGALEAEFSGNITDYYWNDVPMQLKEFQTKVSQILDEAVFKMITNPLAFNQMKWQDRRNALIQIVGEVSDSELASGNSEYENLITQLTNGKTLEDYRKQIAASIKKAKEDLKAIPTRVDEVIRQMPDALDFEQIKLDLTLKNDELNNIDNEIQNANTGIQSLVNQRREQSVAIGNIENDILSIERNARNEANKPVDNSELTNLVKNLDSKKDELLTAENGLKTLISTKTSKEERVTELSNLMTKKREDWTKENEKELTFNDNDFHCPACKRAFESGDVETKKQEALRNFNTQKTETLSSISSSGASLKKEKESVEVEIANLEERIKKGNDFIDNLKNEITKINEDIDTLNSTNSGEAPDVELIYQCILSENNDYKSKKVEVEKLKKELVEVPEVDNAKLIEQRNSIVKEIDDLKAKLNTKTQIDSCNSRISELQETESTLAPQIADVE